MLHSILEEPLHVTIAMLQLPIILQFNLQLATRLVKMEEQYIHTTCARLPSRITLHQAFVDNSARNNGGAISQHSQFTFQGNSLVTL